MRFRATACLGVGEGPQENSTTKNPLSGAGSFQGVPGTTPNIPNQMAHFSI